MATDRAPRTHSGNRGCRHARLASLLTAIAGFASIAMAMVVVLGPVALAAAHADDPQPAVSAGSAKPDRATPTRTTRVGIASVYGRRFKGRRTASGEIYDGDALTAAHKTLPFGTQVKVTHLKTGRAVIVRINDRGPASKGRLIDLSPRAAEELGMRPRRLAKVRIDIVGTPPG